MACMCRSAGQALHKATCLSKGQHPHATLKRTRRTQHVQLSQLLWFGVCCCWLPKAAAPTTATSSNSTNCSYSTPHTRVKKHSQAYHTSHSFIAVTSTCCNANHYLTHCWLLATWQKFAAATHTSSPLTSQLQAKSCRCSTTCPAQQQHTTPMWDHAFIAHNCASPCTEETTARASTTSCGAMLGPTPSRQLLCCLLQQVGCKAAACLWRCK